MPGFVHLAGLARPRRRVPRCAGCTARRGFFRAGRGWPAEGRPQAIDPAASRCTPPARPRAGLRPSGCSWSGHGLPCASAAWPVPVSACRLDAFDRAPGSGAAGVSFALRFRRMRRCHAPEQRGGALLFGKQPGNGESTAPGGSIHGKSQCNPIQINHLEPSYLLVTCWGMLGGKVGATCGMVRRAVQRLPVGQGVVPYPPGGRGSFQCPLVRVIRPPVSRCSPSPIKGLSRGDLLAQDRRKTDSTPETGASWGVFSPFER